MRKLTGLISLLAAAAVLAACGGGKTANPAPPAKAPGGGQSVASTLPMYTTGTQWGPYSDLNPFKNWDYVTGTVGLVYETPFRYDPLKDRFIPWLASAGKWTGKTVYTM